MSPANAEGRAEWLKSATSRDVVSLLYPDHLDHSIASAAKGGDGFVAECSCGSSLPFTPAVAAAGGAALADVQARLEALLKFAPPFPAKA